MKETAWKCRSSQVLDSERYDFLPSVQKPVSRGGGEGVKIVKVLYLCPLKFLT